MFVRRVRLSFQPCRLWGSVYSHPAACTQLLPIGLSLVLSSFDFSHLFLWKNKSGPCKSPSLTRACSTITLCCVWVLWVLWVVQGAGLRLWVVSGCGSKTVFPFIERQVPHSLCVGQCCGTPGPSQHTSQCLPVCFPAFWSTSPSLNGTFLYSMKALYSKDLPAKERVTSFSFFYFFPSPFCSLHP